MQYKRISRLSAVILMLTVVGIAVASEPKNPFHQYCSHLATHQLTTMGTRYLKELDQPDTAMVCYSIVNARHAGQTPASGGSTGGGTSGGGNDDEPVPEQPGD